MAHSLNTAAEIYRDALRRTVERYTLLYLSEGSLLILVGILAIVYPLFTSSAISVPLGWLLIATAVMQSIVLFGMRSMPHFGFQALSVVLAVLIGILLLLDLQPSAQTLVILVITYLLLQGVSRLMFGISIRPFRHWEFVTGSGVLGVILSLILLANLPDPARWLVGLLVGLELIGEGAAIVMLAWDRNQTTKDAKP